MHSVLLPIRELANHRASHPPTFRHCEYWKEASGSLRPQKRYTCTRLLKRQCTASQADHHSGLIPNLNASDANSRISAAKGCPALPGYRRWSSSSGSSRRSRSGRRRRRRERQRRTSKLSRSIQPRTNALPERQRVPGAVRLILQSESAHTVLGEGGDRGRRRRSGMGGRRVLRERGAVGGQRASVSHVHPSQPRSWECSLTLSTDTLL
jgi:hypothetical protein